MRSGEPKRRASLALRAARTAFLLALVLALLGWYLTQPVIGVEERTPALRAEPERLRAGVVMLAQTFAPRDARHPENLARAAEWIRGELAAALGAAELRPFVVQGQTHANVVARAGPPLAEGDELVVVGAHYDAAEPGIGADDNASGVAGLIELARLLAAEPPTQAVELVAFALEEPPYFRTRSMGSYVHAQALVAAGTRVRAMLALEMIGFFDDAPGSQGYPMLGLRLFYPSRADFIAVVGVPGQTGLVRRIKCAMAGAMGLDVRSMNAPRFVPGVDFSDQLNYWDAGFEAVMITDTAFYRNANYHRAGDTPATLDYARMAQVVEGVHAAVLALDR